MKQSHLRTPRTMAEAVTDPAMDPIERPARKDTTGRWAALALAVMFVVGAIYYGLHT